MKRLVAGAAIAGILTIVSSFQAGVSPTPTYAASHESSSTKAASPYDIVATARQYLGSPYAYIGNTPAGFSCIGFVNFVFHQNGVYVPFDIPQAWSSAPHVAASDLMPGDVLFYSNTVFAGLSHVAIYIGNGQMIGADSFAVGVALDRIGDAYWAEHYTGATRPLAAIGAAPAPGQQATATATASATAQPLIANAPLGSTVRTLSDRVSMYSGPGFSYTALATLHAGTLLTVVQETGAWYNVRTSSSMYGWVQAANVLPAMGQTLKESPAQPTPARQGTYAKAAAIIGGQSGTVMYVTQGPLAVRGGPSRGYASRGYVQKGMRLSVRAIQAHWAHITTPYGLTGWVATQYLSVTPALKAAPTAPSAPVEREGISGPQARVVVPALNVRAQPATSAHVLSVIFSGETVRVITRRNGWSEIRLHNGLMGWVSSAYLSSR